MRKRLAALLLALVLAAGCAAAPESGSVSPPVSPSPAPAESPAPPPAEPEPAPVEPEEGPEALPEEPPLKTPEDYTQEQLDFFARQLYAQRLPGENFWHDDGLQMEMEALFFIAGQWLTLTPEQVAEESDFAIASSSDSKKVVYYLREEEYNPYGSYYVWSNYRTGENRLLCTFFSGKNAQINKDDVLLHYDRETITAFSLQTGELLEDYGPPFDCGEEIPEVPEGRERVIYGIAYDEAADYWVVAYANWAERDEETLTFPLRLAVYDKSGSLVRDLATWVKPKYVNKIFYIYAEKMTFPQPGTLCLYYNYNNAYPLRLDYLTDPVPLAEGEILDLWDTLEGVWADPGQPEYGEKGLEAAFFLREGRPVLRVDGAECPVSAVRRWSEITWEITARGGEGERTFYVDTHHPKDFAILVMEKGALEYSNCIYAGEAG